MGGRSDEFVLAFSAHFDRFQGFSDEIPADEKEDCNPQNIEQQEARPLTPDQRDTRRPVPQKRQALISFGGGKDKDCAVIGVSLIPLYREDRALNDRGGDGAHRRIDFFLQGLFPRPVDERLPVRGRSPGPGIEKWFPVLLNMYDQLF